MAGKGGREGQAAGCDVSTKREFVGRQGGGRGGVWKGGGGGRGGGRGGGETAGIIADRKCIHRCAREGGRGREGGSGGRGGTYTQSSVETRMQMQYTRQYGQIIY